jgi:hypothetical protein
MGAVMMTIALVSLNAKSSGVACAYLTVPATSVGPESCVEGDHREGGGGEAAVADGVRDIAGLRDSHSQLQ